jgi:hypothetical protein
MEVFYYNRLFRRSKPPLQQGRIVSKVDWRSLSRCAKYLTDWELLEMIIPKGIGDSYVEFHEYEVLRIAI